MYINVDKVCNLRIDSEKKTVFWEQEKTEKTWLQTERRVNYKSEKKKKEMKQKQLYPSNFLVKL